MIITCTPSSRSAWIFKTPGIGHHNRNNFSTSGSHLKCTFLHKTTVSNNSCFLLVGLDVRYVFFFCNILASYCDTWGCPGISMTPWCLGLKSFSLYICFYTYKKQAEQRGERQLVNFSWQLLTGHVKGEKRAITFTHNAPWRLRSAAVCWWLLSWDGQDWHLLTPPIFQVPRLSLKTWWGGGGDFNLSHLLPVTTRPP